MTSIVGKSTREFEEQIKRFGITPSKIHRNLSVDDLVQLSLTNKEGLITTTGALSVVTGKYTGRSPDDRFIVYDEITKDQVDWGTINHQFPSGNFEKLLEKMKKFVDKIGRAHV